MFESTIDVRTQEVDRLFALQGSQTQGLKDQPIKERIRKVKAIEEYLLETANEVALCKAYWSDLRRSREEVLLTEVTPVLSAAKHIRSNIREWVGDKKVSTPITLVGVESKIRYEPKGRVLIFVPWNYPLQLALFPLMHAVAAGNTVVLKPSEVAPATSAFIKDMLETIFDEKDVAVLEGGPDTAQLLLEKPFDHIFFTGAPSIGKIVMRAAANHLSSVTLELGGKCPVVVDDSVNLKKSAAMTVWAKYMNNGQTCIAPDYLLLDEKIADKYLVALQNAITKQYNPQEAGIQNSEHYGRIVSKKHFNRVRNLLDDAVLKGAKVVIGGQLNAEDLYISPTVLTNVTEDMLIMEEEIFGPLLPIITYRNVKEVPDIIHRRPKPLSMYIQSKRKKVIDYLLHNTSAGGTVINEMNIGTVNPHLPFGGVNNSGIGKSGGHYSFIEFSNERAIMKRRYGTFSMLYAPFKTSLFEWVKKLARF